MHFELQHTRRRLLARTVHLERRRLCRRRRATRHQCCFVPFRAYRVRRLHRPATAAATALRRLLRPPPTPNPNPRSPPPEPPAEPPPPPPSAAITATSVVCSDWRCLPYAVAREKSETSSREGSLSASAGARPTAAELGHLMKVEPITPTLTTPQQIGSQRARRMRSHLRHSERAPSVARRRRTIVLLRRRRRLWLGLRRYVEANRGGCGSFTSAHHSPHAFRAEESVEEARQRRAVDGAPPPCAARAAAPPEST